MLNTLLIANGIPPPTRFPQSIDAIGEWERHSASGVEFWIAGNARVIVGPWHNRKVVIFVKPQSFTLENIKTIFLHLSEKHPVEDFLEIEARSEEGKVRDAARWFAEIRFFSFGNLAPLSLTDGLVTEPPALSAWYRRGGSEYLKYYPATGEPITVDLKWSPPGCPSFGDPAVDLVYASIQGCEDVVAELLAEGIDPNVKSKYGGAALVQASYWGHVKIAKLLLKGGADINQTSASGWTPLIAAIGGNRLSTIPLLLNHRPDVNVRSEDGRTALIHAVVRQNASAVKSLLVRGADVNVTDGYGQTALSIATENHNAEITRLLEKAGASR